MSEEGLDEKMDKIIIITNNEGRYQIFAEFFVVMLWICCNFVTVSLTFLENTPMVAYWDPDEGETVAENLDYDICEDEDYTIIESYDYSMVIDYEIECDDYKVGLIGTRETVGALFSSTIGEFLGAKRGLFISTTVFAILELMMILIDRYWFLLVFGVLNGIADNFICFPSIVLTEEISSDRLRSIFGVLTNCGFSFGGIIWTLLYYGIQNWKIVMGIDAGVIFLVGVVVIVFFFDSPRLSFHQNYNKAYKILRGIAKFNGCVEEFDKKVKEPEYMEILDDFRLLTQPDYQRPDYAAMVTEQQQLNEEGNNQEGDAKQGEVISDTKLVGKQVKEDLKDDDNNKKKETEKTGISKTGGPTSATSASSETEKHEIGFKTLCIYGSIRFKVIVMSLVWFFSSGIFDGLNIGVKGLPGSIYLNAIILHICEIAAYLLVGFLMNTETLGRKKTTIICLFITTALEIVIAFCLDHDTAAITLYVLIQFFLTMPHTLYSIYAVEIFPSNVRNLAYGVIGAFANCGGVLVPLVMELLPDKVIYISFAVLTGVSAVLFFFMEETVNRPMIEEIEEIKQEKEKRKAALKAAAENAQAAQPNNQTSEQQPQQQVELQQIPDDQKQPVQIN